MLRVTELLEQLPANRLLVYDVFVCQGCNRDKKTKSPLIPLVVAYVYHNNISSDVQT